MLHHKKFAPPETSYIDGGGDHMRGHAGRPRPEPDAGARPSHLDRVSARAATIAVTVLWLDIYRNQYCD
jgi:hypothetical protein